MITIAVATQPAAERHLVIRTPANFCASHGVTKAALVPIIRPPTLVAKLPPVPRRCSGNTFGRYSPRKLSCDMTTNPAQAIPHEKTVASCLYSTKVEDR